MPLPKLMMLLRRFAARASASTARPTSLAATDFALGLNMIAQVEIDVNASGAPGPSAEDTEGAPVESYQAVPGLTAVPCRIVQQNWPPPTHMWTKTTSSATSWSKVLFAGVLALDERHRINALDPATGLRRYLYVMGQSKNPHQLGVYTRADCLEFAV